MNIKMKKVYVQIVDKLFQTSQYGMIEESIQKGFEIANALGHFGININSVVWNYNGEETKSGYVEGTSKIVNIVVI